MGILVAVGKGWKNCYMRTRLPNMANVQRLRADKQQLLNCNNTLLKNKIKCKIHKYCQQLSITHRLFFCIGVIGS